MNILKTSRTFTEPVIAAIDVTDDPFHVSPWKAEDDIEEDDEEIVVNKKTGETKTPKDDYPEMVNGGEERNTYEYQYATLTIVGRDAPIVLAVEPVRHDSLWEGDDGESVSWAEIVDRLMQQATKHVDIHTVMADKAFDSHAVFHVLDQYHNVRYLIPKSEDTDYTKQQVKEVEEDSSIDCRVEQGVPLEVSNQTPYIDPDSDPTVGNSENDQFSHEMTYMYVPAERDDWGVRKEDGTDFAVFVTNRKDVTPIDALGYTDRYSDRWDIEMSYKMITPLLPSIASKDYRMRFFSFAFSCLLYNTWRLVDHQAKVLATEKFDDYGRGPHEERLDPLLPLADFLMTAIIEIFRSGLDPPAAT